jgi:hypothetical protein
LASVGIDVTIGSRSKERAQETCTEVCGRFPERNLPLHAGDNGMAADCEVVVVATPWDAAAATAKSVRTHLEGKVVISMANALVKVGDEFQPLVPPRGSVAAHLQASVPEARVAAAFHHLPAHALFKLDVPVESDVLICSDHASATALTAEIVECIPDLRPLDAGSLSNAASIEAFTAVLLQLNVRYKARAAIRMTGVNLS